MKDQLLQAAQDLNTAAREALVECDEPMPALRAACDAWDTACRDSEYQLASTCLICGSQVAEIGRDTMNSRSPAATRHPLYEKPEFSTEPSIMSVIQFACSMGHRGMVMEKPNEAIRMEESEKPDG
jgi:hypothetical protein